MVAPHGKHIAGTYLLQEAADLALSNILARLDPALDYQPFFQLDWGSDPPEAHHASWDYCDMAGRFVDALILIRQMTGNEEGREAEERLRSFLLGRADPRDGLFYDGAAPWSKRGADMFCQGRALLGLVSWFLLARDPTLEATIERLIAGLSRIADHHGDACSYPHDVYADGRWTDGGLWHGKAPGYWAQQTIGLARFAEATGSAAALQLAGKLARHFVYHSGVVNVDGTFRGHTHSGGILPSTLGVLRYALVAGDDDLATWSRRTYEYARGQSSTFGWVPDGMALDPATNPFAGTCETCSVVDMLELALKLTEAGLGNYWDDVERYTRNQFLENQIRDPELVVPTDRRRDSQTPVAAIVRGSFESTAAPNSLLSGPRQEIEGCCTGAAGRGCFLVWERIITEQADGVFVNLAFSRESEAVEVISQEPYSGTLVVRAKQARNLFVRVPGWAERDRVQVSAGGVDRSPAWQDDYLALGAVEPGQELIITYPQQAREEQVSIAGRDYAVRWKGGTVVGIEPGGERYPIYRRQMYDSVEPPQARDYGWRTVPVRW